jgi:hypothetical protein
MRELGKARGLWDLLVDKQTDAKGAVWYGKAISYDWIRSKLLNPPPERTLRRWMARLKQFGFVRVRLVPYEGFVVYLLRSDKFARQPQLPFPLEVHAGGLPAAKPVEKPVEKLLEGPKRMRPQVAACIRPQVAAQRSKEPNQGTINPARANPARDSSLWNSQAKARRLRSEIQSLMASIAGSGPSDRDLVASVNEKIELRVAELDRLDQFQRTG